MSTVKPEENKSTTPATSTTTSSTPAPSTPAAATTTAAAAAAAATPAYPTTPWAATSTTHATTIPYQHYQAYSSHYPQAAYGHYQYAAPLTAQTMQAQLSRPGTVSTPVPNTATTTVANTTANATAATTSTTNTDSTDVATLNDALGSAGVDLRAEEESLQRSHDQHQPYRPYEDRTRKQPFKPSFDTIHLGTKMRTIGASHKVTKIPDDSINYLALALRARLQDLITNMIAASHHRTDTQFDRPASLYTDETPMWRISVRSDVAKQLAVLERVEREEEIKVRRERKERAEMTAAHAAALAAQANGNAAAGASSGDTSGSGTGMEEEGSAKKKRKKDGPGVTARNMSEDVRKKMSNAVATQAAGLGGKYAWMTAANANTPAPKPKPAAVTSTTSTTTPVAATTGTIATASTPSVTTNTATPGNASAASSWARPYVPTKKSSSNMQANATAEEDTRITVTMRDAMFVVEKERGHGGGRGAARGFI